LLLKVPDRQLTLILLASSDRASSPFGPELRLQAAGRIVEPAM
jgi:hypothetical protein